MGISTILFYNILVVRIVQHRNIPLQSVSIKFLPLPFSSRNQALCVRPLWTPHRPKHVFISKASSGQVCRTYREFHVVLVLLDVAETVPTRLVSVAAVVVIFLLPVVVAVLVVGDAVVVVQGHVVVGAGGDRDEEPATRLSASLIRSDSNFLDFWSGSPLQAGIAIVKQLVRIP